MFISPIFAFQTPTSTLTPTLSDAAEVTDSVTATRARAVSVSDTMAVSDTAIRSTTFTVGPIGTFIITYPRPANDTIAVTDYMTLPAIVDISDSAISVSDSCPRPLFFPERTITETPLIVTDELNVNGIKSVFVSESPIVLEESGGYPQWVRHRNSASDLYALFDGDYYYSGSTWDNQVTNPWGGYASDLYGYMVQNSDANGHYYLSGNGTNTGLVADYDAGYGWVPATFFGDSTFGYGIGLTATFKAASSQNNYLVRLGTSTVSYFSIKIDQGGGGVIVSMRVGGVQKSFTLPLEPNTWQSLIVQFDTYTKILTGKISTATSIVTNSVSCGANMDDCSVQHISCSVGYDKFNPYTSVLTYDTYQLYISPNCNSSYTMGQPFPDFAEWAAYVNDRFTLNIREV